MNTNSASQYTYEELFQRNIGVFTPEEQEKIKNLKVAIAGVGGLGGPMAYNLARLGVKEIRLADPDIFEPSNMNRQFGCYVDTIGLNKAEAIGAEISRINPHLRVKSWSEGINSGNIDNFLDDIDVVIDGIDFFELDIELMLHEKTREKKQWIFACQGAFNIISFLVFDPNGSSLLGMVKEGDVISLKKAIISMFPILPEGATITDIENVVEEATKKGSYHIPSYVVLSPIGGALVTQELVNVVIRKKEPLVKAPNLFFIDLYDLKIHRFIDGKVLL